ncbi:MAG: glycosyltransferase, partial [Clostridiales bacterium]|nr:glycosyltransferase [Clostridiales bacterium]
MKILLLTHMYANPDRSDLGNHLPALQVFAQWWTQAGHDVTVLQLYRHYGRDARVRVPLYGSRVARYEVDGVPVIRIECRYVARLSALTEPYFRRLARRAKALLPAGVDVMLVHFPMALAGFADSLDAGCPRVMTLHSTDIERLAAPGG